MARPQTAVEGLNQNMQHYKSWQGLNKALTERLCDALKGRITYFLTRYHDVHDAYGRAAVRLDGKDAVCFAWNARIHQDSDLYDEWKKNGTWDPDASGLRKKWQEAGVLCDMDFLEAASSYLNLPVSDALNSPDPVCRMLAVMDRRTGKRTLERLAEGKTWLSEPEWVRPFYLLRLQAEGLLEK